MRPDEHKKKRSAQYQRKHGGGKDKSGGDESKAAAKQTKSKDGNTGKQSARSSHQPVASPPPRNADLSASDSEDEEESRSAKTQKTYSRREIANNWGKYDLPPLNPEDSAAAPKGQDFNKVLDLTGSALAHFRFKEEHAWEEEQERDGDQDPVPTLDCEQLAASLDCLPLYTQLSLDKHIFTSDQLAAMDEEARKHQLSMPGFTSDQRRNTPVMPHKSQDAKPTAQQSQGATTRTKSHFDANDASKKSVKTVTFNKEGSIVGGSSVTPAPRQSQTISSEDRTLGELGTVSGKQGPGVASAGITDEALDSLLEGEDPVKGSPETQAGASSVTKTGDSFSDRDLDDLLSVSSIPSTAVKDTPPASSEAKGAGAAADSADLEDWLDSVLDS